MNRRQQFNETLFVVFASFGLAIVLIFLLGCSFSGHRDGFDASFLTSRTDITFRDADGTTFRSRVGLQGPTKLDGSEARMLYGWDGGNIAVGQDNRGFDQTAHTEVIVPMVETVGAAAMLYLALQSGGATLAADWAGQALAAGEAGEVTLSPSDRALVEAVSRPSFAPSRTGVMKALSDHGFDPCAHEDREHDGRHGGHETTHTPPPHKTHPPHRTHPPVELTPHPTHIPDHHHGDHRPVHHGG